MKKAVFIDKDGTLIKDISYNVNPDLIEFEAYAIEALRLLQESDFLLIIVTNQAGVALNYFSEEDLKKVHSHLKDLLEQNNITLSGFHYCPHHPQGNLALYSFECNCRKPAPGMLLNAASKMNIDVSESWMIGDILNDVEAGNRAGCRTILIDNGNETEWKMNSYRKPHYSAKDLKQAAEIIINSKN